MSENLSLMYQIFEWSACLSNVKQVWVLEFALRENNLVSGIMESLIFETAVIPPKRTQLIYVLFWTHYVY